MFAFIFLSQEEREEVYISIKSVLVDWSRYQSGFRTGDHEVTGHGVLQEGGGDVTFLHLRMREPTIDLPEPLLEVLLEHLTHEVAKP